jgi:hypothetical protein
VSRKTPNMFHVSVWEPFRCALACTRMHDFPDSRLMNRHGPTGTVDVTACRSSAQGARPGPSGNQPTTPGCTSPGGALPDRRPWRTVRYRRGARVCRGRGGDVPASFDRFDEPPMRARFSAGTRCSPMRRRWVADRSERAPVGPQLNGLR